MKSVIKYLSYTIITFFILTLTALLFFLYSPKTFDWLAHKISTPYGFAYSRLSGTLLNGIEVEKLTFKNKPLLEKIILKWDLLPLLTNNLSLKQLSIDALDVNNTQIAIDSFLEKIIQKIFLYLFPLALTNLP